MSDPGESTVQHTVQHTGRVAPVPYAEWDHDVFSVLSRKRRLPPSNALGLLAQHPDLARAFLTFNKHLNTSTLPTRTRELAILRVAWRRRCAYEWVNHILIARKAGVPDEEIEEVRAGADTLLNRAVDELDTNSFLSDETYRSLSADLDDHQLMDLVFTVGAYLLLAMALNTFEVELDPGVADENFNFPR